MIVLWYANAMPVDMIFNRHELEGSTVQVFSGKETLPGMFALLKKPFHFGKGFIKMEIIKGLCQAVLFYLSIQGCKADI